MNPHNYHQIDMKHYGPVSYLVIELLVGPHEVSYSDGRISSDEGGSDGMVHSE